MTEVSEGTYVVTFDYRGFGDSSKVFPDEKSILSDCIGLFKWIVEQGVSPQNIILVGHSLGSGISLTVAHELTKKRIPPGGVVTLAAYTSIPEAATVYPYIPLLKPFSYKESWSQYAQSVVSVRWNGLERIQHLKCPILLIHGQGDFELPIQFSKRLFVAAIGAEGVTLPTMVSEETHFKHYMIQPIENEANLWISKDTQQRVWLLNIFQGGHNNLHRFHLVQDGIRQWLEEHDI
jgi:abhydrolase domain-containing protein 12